MNGATMTTYYTVGYYDYTDYSSRVLVRLEYAPNFATDDEAEEWLKATLPNTNLSAFVIMELETDEEVFFEKFGEAEKQSLEQARQAGWLN
jgi:hypothetical protein